jgi:WD40 repeat protein
LAFSPFHDGLLGTASEDGRIKLWLIPDEGIEENTKEEDMELVGHTKKVMALRWHPIAENVVASYSIDGCVKIWDVASGNSGFDYTGHSNLPTAMRWSPRGDVLGMMLKGHQMTFIDPRKEDSVLTGASHQGPRS